MVVFSEKCRLSIDSKEVVCGYDDLSHFKQYWGKNRAMRLSLYDQLSKNVIETPYADDPSDYFESQEGRAYRKNHGTTHAIRQVELLTHYLKLMKSAGKKELVQCIANSLTIEEEACLELAAFLFRAGRTNECSWQDDLTYGARSAEIFITIASALEFNHTLIKYISLCFDYGNIIDSNTLTTPLPERSLNNSFLVIRLFSNLLKLTHETDLVRCNTNLNTLKTTIEKELNNLLDNSYILDQVADSFLKYAITLCRKTGAAVVAVNSGSATTSENAVLAVRSAKNLLCTFEKLRMLQADEVPINFFESPTKLWLESSHHVNTSNAKRSFLGHNKQGKEVELTDGWNEEAMRCIPESACIKLEEQYITSHVCCYHATKRENYIIDLFCRSLKKLLNDPSDIFWVRDFHSKPGRGEKITDINAIKSLMAKGSIDNQDFAAWNLLSCNPSLWQNTDYASEESTVDFFYNNLSVKTLNFHDIITNILEKTGLLVDMPDIRIQLLAQFDALCRDTNYGSQGALYQYLIPHHLVNEVAYVSQTNGIVDIENPSALNTLMTLKSRGCQASNHNTLQVRLLVTKLLDPAFAANIHAHVHLNVPDEARQSLDNAAINLAKLAYQYGVSKPSETPEITTGSSDTDTSPHRCYSRGSMEWSLSFTPTKAKKLIETTEDPNEDSIYSLWGV